MPSSPPRPPSERADSLALARAAYRRQLRDAPTDPDGRFERVGPLRRTVLPPPRMSWIDSGDLRGADLDVLIGEQIAWFRRHGGPFEWTVYASDPRAPELLDHLARHGFEIDEPEAIMLFDLAADELSAPDLPDAARVTEIGSERLGEVQRVLEAVWERPFDWIPERFGAHLSHPGYLRLFLAEIRDAAGAWNPAAAAWVYFPAGSDFARLYGGSTVAAQRGRGLYRTLLASRAAAARAAGRRWLTVDTGAMSRPIVARLGFRQLDRAWACVRRPSASDASR